MKQNMYCNRQSRNIWIYTVAMLVCFLLMPFPSPGAEESLTLQVYPFAPASSILKHFTPLANYLSKELGRKVVIRISKDHVDHMSTVGNDKADIAYLGPATYVKIVDTYGKKPLIARLETHGSPMLKGVIIISTSSTVQSLKDLRGKRFAFGYPDSTMSHLIPLYMMQREGIAAEDLARYAFLHDQHNVALGVLMGDFDAGAVNAGVFNKYKGRGLKDLVWTPEVSEHLFVARASLSGETVEAVRKALFRVKDIKNGDAILSSFREGVTAFVPTSDRDYDNLRKLLRKLD
jgi:phosphonate transport system substrate-binding protein